MNTQSYRRIPTAMALVAFAMFANTACTTAESTPPPPSPTTSAPHTTPPTPTPTTTAPHRPPAPPQPPQPPPAPPPTADDAGTEICDTAAAAYNTLGRSGDLVSVANAIGTIRQLNLQRSDSADGLFFQVWQVVDAWNGTMDLLNDPSTADLGTPEAVEAALGNLVQFCEQ
jgi:hypothetical protein